MPRNPVFISVILIVLSLIVTTYYFQKVSVASHNAVISHRYDMFSDNMHQTEFNANGFHSSTSRSPHVTHYPAGNYALFKKPHIVSYNKDSPWLIDADHGKKMENSDTTYFIGHVAMTQAATHTAPKTVINTVHATIFSNHSFASTDAPVTIDQGTTHITSIGATADLKNGVIRLLSHTQGHASSKQQAPYYFSSDSLTYTTKNHTLTFTGHVSIDQGTTHLAGDNVIIYLTPVNKMKLLIDTGHQATYVSISKTNPNTLKAKANTITYDPSYQLIYLDGNAFVNQNHNTLSASHIIYDKAHDIVHTHRSKEQGFTHIVVMPQKTPPTTAQTGTHTIAH